ncbi:hypothetical protein BKA70DRAFT_1234084 [Coprinopsis sp. MPI-PUGE-AT-0042]|nr:hypothetical protein BKA70DRAFT_1234084 [Coprinopsis sp. MPI-PUGE-AT-0042]
MDHRRQPRGDDRHIYSTNDAYGRGYLYGWGNFPDMYCHPSYVPTYASRDDYRYDGSSARTRQSQPRHRATAGAPGGYGTERYPPTMPARSASGYSQRCFIGKAFGNHNRAVIEGDLDMLFEDDPSLYLEAALPQIPEDHDGLTIGISVGNLNSGFVSEKGKVTMTYKPQRVRKTGTRSPSSPVGAYNDSHSRSRNRGRGQESTHGFTMFPPSSTQMATSTSLVYGQEQSLGQAPNAERHCPCGGLNNPGLHLLPGWEVVRGEHSTGLNSHAYILNKDTKLTYIPFFILHPFQVPHVKSVCVREIKVTIRIPIKSNPGLALSPPSSPCLGTHSASEATWALQDLKRTAIFSPITHSQLPGATRSASRLTSTRLTARQPGQRPLGSQRQVLSTMHSRQMGTNEMDGAFPAGKQNRLPLGQPLNETRSSSLRLGEYLTLIDCILSNHAYFQLSRRSLVLSWPSPWGASMSASSLCASPSASTNFPSMHCGSVFGGVRGNACDALDAQYESQQRVLASMLTASSQCLLGFIAMWC